MEKVMSKWSSVYTGAVPKHIAYMKHVNLDSILMCPECSKTHLLAFGVSKNFREDRVQTPAKKAAKGKETLGQEQEERRGAAYDGEHRGEGLRVGERARSMVRLD